MGCQCLNNTRRQMWTLCCSRHKVTMFFLLLLVFFLVLLLHFVDYNVCHLPRLSAWSKNKSKGNHVAKRGKLLLKIARIFLCRRSAIISHLKTVAYLAVQLHRSKRWPNYSITPSLMVSMAARCIFPRDAPWRNECLINHHPGNNTPSSLCRMCQTLTRTLGEISLPVQPQPLIWT